MGIIFFLDDIKILKSHASKIGTNYYYYFLRRKKKGGQICGIGIFHKVELARWVRESIPRNDSNECLVYTAGDKESCAIRGNSRRKKGERKYEETGFHKKRDILNWFLLRARIRLSYFLVNHLTIISSSRSRPFLSLSLSPPLKIYRYRARVPPFFLSSPPVFFLAKMKTKRSVERKFSICLLSSPSILPRAYAKITRPTIEEVRVHPGELPEEE